MKFKYPVAHKYLIRFSGYAQNISRNVTFKYSTPMYVL